MTSRAIKSALHFCRRIVVEQTSFNRLVRFQSTKKKNVAPNFDKLHSIFKICQYTQYVLFLNQKFLYDLSNLISKTPCVSVDLKEPCKYCPTIRAV